MNFKVKTVFALILALIIISISCNVFANDLTVGSLAVSTVASVNKGEEFTVTIDLSNFGTSASSVTIIGKIEYDKDKLEYISNSILSNTGAGWDGIGEESFRESNMAFILENRNAKNIEANSNLLTLKFRAKTSAEGNAEIKVVVNSVSDATNFSGDAKTVAITKKAEQVESKPSDEKKPTEEQSKPKNEVDNNKITTNAVKDTTTAKGKLPQTGANDALWVVVAVCVLGAVINFAYMKKDKKE